MSKLITSIEIQEKNKNRVNIFLNNDYEFSCNAEIIYRLNLKKGSFIDENYIKEIAGEDDFLKAKNIALKSLEKSYKSEKEVELNLIKNGFDKEIINSVIQFLKMYNIVDDIKYAEAYVQSNMKIYGKNKINYSLLKKGIDKIVVQEALINISDASEEENAEKIAGRKYSSLISAGKEKSKIYKSIGDSLIRKGYDSDTVKSVLSRVVKNIPEDCDVKVESACEEIAALAEKRYKILMKSENDSKKLYKKLTDYLMRRGFTWEEVRSVVDRIINE